MKWLKDLLREKATTLPAALVTPHWLHDNLEKVNLLEASFAMPNSGKDVVAQYQTKHLQGAQFFNLADVADKNSPLPHMLPSAEDFAAALIRLGFDRRKPTIIYDDGSTVGACRLWWMFRVFGYDKTALLNGGLPAWEAAHYPVTSDIPQVTRGYFTAQFRPELVWTMEQVTANLTEGETVLLDARAAARFRGEQAEPRPGLQRGHIPGARNLPFTELLDATTGEFKSIAEMQSVLTKMCIATNTPITATCGSGMTACVIAFALHLLDSNSNIAVYDGSWAEWGSSGNPVMMGA